MGLAPDASPSLHFIGNHTGSVNAVARIISLGFAGWRRRRPAAFDCRCAPPPYLTHTPCWPTRKEQLHFFAVLLKSSVKITTTTRSPASAHSSSDFGAGAAKMLRLTPSCFSRSSACSSACRSCRKIAQGFRGAYWAQRSTCCYAPAAVLRPPSSPSPASSPAPPARPARRRRR